MKLKVSIVVIALVAGIGFMVASSINKDAKKFYQLTEFEDALKQNRDQVAGKYLIVLGNVKEGSIARSGIEADFVMEMGDSAMKVHHNGKNLLPDTFQSGAQVTVEGCYDAAANVFTSDKVMAKCASKYQDGNIKGMSEQGTAAAK